MEMIDHILHGRLSQLVETCEQPRSASTWQH